MKTKIIFTDLTTNEISDKDSKNLSEEEKEVNDKITRFIECISKFDINSIDLEKIKKLSFYS
ncbi:hypothetical protein ACFL56_03630, partial [Candidatus Margulisiibacteriota bacterium]